MVKELQSRSTPIPVIKTQDRAHEFRISIEGRLAGECVQQVASIWASALAESLPRQIAVEISYLTGYDLAGAKLLREMSNHGTLFSASTPGSLVFLAEITGPRRRNLFPLPEPIPMPALNSAAEARVQPLRRAAGAK